jgi:hypothetical protein
MFIVCLTGVVGTEQAGRVRRRNPDMADTSETHVTRDVGSGVAGESGVAYDAERLGEPGDPGVPKGDQYPTNERENITEGGYGGVGIDDVPGTRTPGEPVSSEPEPPEAPTRQGRPLGELTEDVSTSDMAAARKMASTGDPYSHEDAAQQRSEKHSAE